MRPKVDAAAQIYKKGLSELDLMVRATEQEVINVTGHALLITDNINFFTKSFLISTCAHLEMCVKDIVFAVATDLDERLSIASVPASIIEWRYSQKKKSDAASPQTQRLGIGLTKKLKSTEFCLSCQAEHLHAIRVLPFDDEFREGIAFFPSHEKSWQGVAKRGSHDEFGGRNAWSNRSQPGAE